jgi:hypothetical protein
MPCQYLHFNVFSLLDLDGDHLISIAGRYGIYNIVFITYIALRDGNSFAFLPLDLAYKVCN